MSSEVQLEVSTPSEMTGHRSLIAGLMVLIALLAALFYGVAGEDKFLLISPLSIAAYACIAAWMLKSVISPHSPLVMPSGGYLLLLFIAYGAALYSVSAIPYETKTQMLELGLYAGAYVVWSNSLTMFRRSRIVLGWVLLFALFLSLYGLVNHFRNPEQVLWAERYFVYEGRLSSTYICPNHLAHLLQMLLPFCLVLLLIPRAGWFVRILAAYCIAVFIPTITLTESRAGMLGSLAALGVTICLLALRKSRKLFILMIVLIPLFSAILLVGAWNYSEMFKRRMDPVVQFVSEFRDEGFANASITDFRPLTWLDTVDLIKEKPATGFGPGTYRYVFPEYRKRFKANRIITGHPHNEYLEVISEYGFTGFALLSAAWGYVIVRMLAFSLKTQHQHHAFVAIAFLGTAAGTLVHSFFDFQMDVFQNALVFALLAAIAVGPIVGRRQELLLKNGAEGMRGRVLQTARKLMLAAVAAAGLLLSLQLFSSAFIRAAADRLAEAKKPEAAKRSYRRATAIDPTNWRAYKGIGGIYFKQRYYTLESEEKRKLAAIEKELFAAAYLHNPKDAGILFDYGKATLFLGDTGAGLALLKQAALLRPFNDMYWARLGIEQRRAERYDEAIESFRYAATLRNSTLIRANIAWLERRGWVTGEAETQPAVKLEPLDIDTQQTPADEETSLMELFQLMDAE